MAADMRLYTISAHDYSFVMSFLNMFNLNNSRSFLVVSKSIIGFYQECF